eukprot:GHVN01010454.1.p1 GENE.GHVN01010454.1~~GHVN01010454.1.p1  ORF type:complete len:528 (+),score=86.11 GHVN01010454.1:54-1637(+)
MCRTLTKCLVVMSLIVVAYNLAKFPAADLDAEFARQSIGKLVTSGRTTQSETQNRDGDEPHYNPHQESEDKLLRSEEHGDPGEGLTNQKGSAEGGTVEGKGRGNKKFLGRMGAVAHPLDIKPGLVWVIPVYKRSWALNLVLQSLVLAKASESTIIISQDSDDDEIREVAEAYVKKGDLPNLQLIKHPWACSRHPDSFPGDEPSLNEGFKGDSYGNLRSPWATCLKHHWWWLLNYVWGQIADKTDPSTNTTDTVHSVCVLEEDIVIKPESTDWIKQHLSEVNKGMGLKLTSDQTIGVPWCMGRDVWRRVYAAGVDFCTHDDYNWDQTLAWLTSGYSPHDPHSPYQPTNTTNTDTNWVAAPKINLSLHVGSCEGWDQGGGRKKACTASDQSAANRKAQKFFSNTPRTTDMIKKGFISTQWLKAHRPVNGGWAHRRDHEHCAQVSGHLQGLASLREQEEALFAMGALPKIKVPSRDIRRQLTGDSNGARKQNVRPKTEQKLDRQGSGSLKRQKRRLKQDNHPKKKHYKYF